MFNHNFNAKLYEWLSSVCHLIRFVIIFQGFKHFPMAFECSEFVYCKTLNIHGICFWLNVSSSFNTCIQTFITTSKLRPSFSQHFFGVCVLILYMNGESSRNPDLWESSRGNFLYSQSFCQKFVERKSPKIFSNYEKIL